MRTSMLAGGRSSGCTCLAEEVRPALAAVLESSLSRTPTASSLKTLKRLPTASSSRTFTLQDGAGHTHAHSDGRSQCARSRSPFPALSLPGFPLSCRARSVAASGRSALKRDPVSAYCHVLRSLRYVSEPRAVGASAPGLQQHHPDMQWQHPADQPSQ